MPLSGIPAETVAADRRRGEVQISPGVWMPVLGLGTFKIRGEDATRATYDALQSGCRHIDTASCYRNETEIRLGIDLWLREDRSEERVRKDKVEEEIPIGQSPSASAPVRPNTEDRVFITSKLAPNEMGERHAAVALESIHARLNTPAQTKEPLDLALIHWPGKSKTPPTSPANLAARRETWKFLEQSLQQTDVRAIGVSNYTSAHLAEMKAYARVMPAVNQVEFHPRCQQRELRKTCESMGIGLVAYSPLGCGELLTDERVLRCAKALGEAIGGTVSPARALIAWSLRQDGVVAVVVKSSDGERIGEFILIFIRAIRLTSCFVFLTAANVGSEGFKAAARLASLSGGMFDELDEMDDDTHYCWNPAVVK